jgi:hypothetical protein
VADSEEDSLFDDVSAMAERIGLKGRDKERYIHEHMTRGGYRAVPSYVRDEEEEEEDEGHGSGFFGSGSQRRRQRPDDRDRGSRPPRRGSRDPDDWYG